MFVQFIIFHNTKKPNELISTSNIFRQFKHLRKIFEFRVSEIQKIYDVLLIEFWRFELKRINGIIFRFRFSNHLIFYYFHSVLFSKVLILSTLLIIIKTCTVTGPPYPLAGSVERPRDGAHRHDVAREVSSVPP